MKQKVEKMRDKKRRDKRGEDEPYEGKMIGGDKRRRPKEEGG